MELAEYSSIHVKKKKPIEKSVDPQKKNCFKNRWIHRKKVALKIFGGSVDIGGSKNRAWEVFFNTCKKDTTN